MAKRKKIVLPFDKRGGVIVLPIRMLKSQKYRSLSPHARCLAIELQIHWRNDKPVNFGIREAAEVLSCNQRTAMAAFKQLEEGAFIKKVDESFFDVVGAGGSRARSWKLNWMPWFGKSPTQDWEN